MNTLELKLQSAQAKQVFRKFRIIPGGLAGVRLGYEKYGTPFMVALLKAISPATSVLNGNYGDADFIGQPTVAEYAATEGAGKGWDWWNTLLTTVGKTGATISQFKNDVSGIKQNPETFITPPATQKNNTILYVVGAVVLLGILFFIFKK